MYIIIIMAMIINHNIKFSEYFHVKILQHEVLCINFS